jgi:splicing factor U2AF subunit
LHVPHPQFGQVTAVVIPRPPAPGQPAPPGLGKVIVEFADVAGAVKAQSILHGRRFGGRTVVATYLSEAQYAAGDLD